VLAATLTAVAATAAVFSLVGVATIRVRQVPIGLTSVRVAGSAGARQAASVLVASEIALAVVLLVGAGLILRSFSNLLAVDPGFSPANVLTMTVALPADRYATPPARADFFARAFPALRAIPGVTAAGAAAVMPLTGNNWTVGFARADRPLPPGQRPPDVGWQVASGDYFEAMRIPLRAGRTFDASDATGPPVVIISEAIAREFFAGEDAVGKRVRQGTEDAEIVGVVGDIRRATLTDRPRQDMYMPFERQPGGATTLFLRTAGDPLAAAPAVRDALRRLEPNLLVGETTSMDAVRSTSVASTTFALWLLGVFATIALVLAVIGVYGVMSYSVRQRTREIGTRLALGATRRDIVWLVVRQGGGIAIAGLVAGVLLGGIAAQPLSAMLHDVSAIDPGTLVGAVAVLGVASLLACYVPARRAARLDAARTLTDS
jgi:putative ABC transport system permease protein